MKWRKNTVEPPCLIIVFIFSSNFTMVYSLCVHIFHISRSLTMVCHHIFHRFPWFHHGFPWFSQEDLAIDASVRMAVTRPQASGDVVFVL